MDHYTRIFLSSTAIKRAIWSVIIMGFCYMVIVGQQDFQPIQIVAN